MMDNFHIDITSQGKLDKAMEVASAQLNSDVERLRAALSGIVSGWEALPGGRNYMPGEIERWLKDNMKPAIDAARIELSRLREVRRIKDGRGGNPHGAAAT